MSDELLPCPFCGGEAALGSDGDFGAVVACLDCGVTGNAYGPDYAMEDYQERAIAAWNSRTSAARIRDLEMQLAQAQAALTWRDAKIARLEAEAVAASAPVLPYPIRSVLDAALIVYITECRQVDDPDGETLAHQAQQWLDSQRPAPGQGGNDE